MLISLLAGTPAQAHASTKENISTRAKSDESAGTEAAVDACVVRDDDTGPQSQAGSGTEAQVEADESPSTTALINRLLAEQKLPTKHRINYDNLFALRGAPLGLVNRFDIGYRRQLIQRSGAIFADSQASARVRMTLTPAFSAVGPRFELQPLTVIRIAATYQYVQYFRTFGTLQSYPDANADHSRDRQAELQEAGRNLAATGHQLDLEILAQLKFSIIIIRNDADFRFFHFPLSRGDTVFHDKLLDTLLPNGGFTLINNLDLLAELPRGFYVGARWDAIAPFYRPEHGAGSRSKDNLNGPIHRLGPAVVWEIFNRPGSRFNQPSLFILAQWHLAHRYRTGQVFHQGIPMISAGLFFKGDFWSKD